MPQPSKNWHYLHGDQCAGVVIRGIHLHLYLVGEVMEKSRMCFYLDPEREHDLSLFCSFMALLAALSGLRGLL